MSMHASATANGFLRCKTTASASNQSISIASSSFFSGCTSRPSTRARASAWPCASGSWNATGGESGSNRNLDTAPLFSSPFPTRTERGDMNASTPLTPVEILIVEDNPGDVRLAREGLSECKIRNNLHAVDDGVKAMAFLRRQGEYAAKPRPDLILLDLNLPKKDGREVLREIKEDKSLRLIPV